MTYGDCSIWERREPPQHFIHNVLRNNSGQSAMLWRTDVRARSKKVNSKLFEIGQLGGPILSFANVAPI
jgi:hypothetical protein